MARAKPDTTSPAAEAAPVATLNKRSTAVGATKSVQEQIAAQLLAQKGSTGEFGSVKIKTKGKKFETPDGVVTTDPMDLIIVDFVSVNALYEGTYDPNDIQPPVCYAVHKLISEMAPADTSPEKQCDTCAACPNNQFGSAGAGKACKNGRKLAVLPADFTDESPMWILDVSPTALKYFDKYVSSLARNGILASMVSTVVSFSDADYPQLQFGEPQPLSDDVIAAVFDRQDEAKEMLMRIPDFTPRAPTTKAPASRAKAAPARRGAR